MEDNSFYFEHTSSTSSSLQFLHNARILGGGNPNANKPKPCTNPPTCTGDRPVLSNCQCITQAQADANNKRATIMSIIIGGVIVCVIILIIYLKRRKANLARARAVIVATNKPEVYNGQPQPNQFSSGIQMQEYPQTYPQTYPQPIYPYQQSPQPYYQPVPQDQQVYSQQQDYYQQTYNQRFIARNSYAVNSGNSSNRGFIAV